MNSALNIYKAKFNKGERIDAMAVMAYRHGHPVGWMLVTRDTDGFYFMPRKQRACIHVFVKDEFRMQKIGKRLLLRAPKIMPDDIFEVYEHNNPSFFKGFLRNIRFEKVEW